MPHTAPALASIAERVLHVLVVFRRESNQDRLEEADMEVLRDIEAAYDEWERQVKAEAKAEANRETLIDMIRALCERFQIELTADRLAQLTT